MVTIHTPVVSVYLNSKGLEPNHNRILFLKKVYIKSHKQLYQGYSIVHDKACCISLDNMGSMQRNKDMVTNPKLFWRFSHQNGTLQLNLFSCTWKAGRVLTEDIHIGTGKDGAMLVAGLTLVHSTVLKLKVGKADLSGRDSPSECPTWKDSDCVRSWRKHHDCGVHCIYSLLESQRQGASSEPNLNLAQKPKGKLQSTTFASSLMA